MSRHKHAVAAGVIVSLALMMPAAVAQSIPSGPAPAAAKAPVKGAKKGAAAEGQTKTDPAAALKSLEAGVKSYEAGKLEPAVQSLSHALSGGGLPSQQMARALYYRGLAYRKQGKPAQAISDLTSAIWLKGGLIETERANAIENRALAYKEAGLGEPPPLADSVRTATTTSTSPTSAAAPAPAKPSATTPAPASQTTQAASAAQPPVPLAAPSAQPITTSSAAPPASSSGGGIGSLFGGLFGGSSAPANTGPAQSPSTTASTGPAAATSSWSDATTVAAGKTRTAAAVPVPVTAVASPAPASAPAAKTAPSAAASKVAEPAAKALPKGKFRLQVAAVRSRTEAETLAKKLKEAHGPAIGGREPAIEESVIGAMGTFYRVRVGPYADANEPRQLCSRIKPDGFDCLVVTQ